MVRSMFLNRSRGCIKPAQDTHVQKAELEGRHKEGESLATTLLGVNHETMFERAAKS